MDSSLPQSLPYVSIQNWIFQNEYIQILDTFRENDLIFAPNLRFVCHIQNPNEVNTPDFTHLGFVCDQHTTRSRCCTRCLICMSRCGPGCVAWGSISFPCPDMETLTDTFQVQGTTVDIQLARYTSSDAYGTNLNLTGQKSWFGSFHLCEYFAAEGPTVFARPGCRVLELGSGIGRAGIMAAKVLLQYQNHGAQCLLTDGEAELVDLMRANCHRNELMLNDEAKRSGCKVDCQVLKWGPNTELDAVSSTFPDGFDVIFGADLIYGPTSARACEALMCTARALLRPGSGTFILTFTRRETLRLDEVLDIASKFGLSGSVHPQYIVDIFDNCVDLESVFWRDCILRFHLSR